MGQFDTAPGPDTNAPEPAATITAADQQAKDFIEGFRALVAAKLPKFELPHPLTAPLVRRPRNVPPGFAKTVASMAALNPDMQEFKHYDLEGNKADQQQIDAYNAVKQELITTLKGVSFFIVTKQAKTNVASFQMQAYAETLTKDPAFAHLLPALDTIKQARRPNKTKAKSEPQSPSNPTSQNGGPLLTH
jgi:hypothetical protein